MNTNTEKIRLFLLQAGAGKIAAALKRPDRRSVKLALAAIFRQLPATDRQLIRGMMREAVMGGTPTRKERELVHWIGAALEKRLK